MLQLRDYQIETVERIRALIRDGHKNILCVSPTGSGKTVIATHMVAEVDRKGHHAAFVVDRLSLIEQTSRTFDDEGIEHGVIQGEHRKAAPHRRVQVASQQTLARRKWPKADVIFVDEAHTVTETVKERLTPRDTVSIGLTATPFTKGLGQLYDAVVNVTTTNKLIADGHLSKFRIFAPSEPDMAGVKIVAGEYEEKEAASRAMKVVGDCVTEYLKRGKGRKFICSAVNVDHVMELQRQFQAAGIPCATYTYKDLADDRADIVREFRKADSNIRGLITVTAASKGFDVPDIGVVIMARPLAKSLAEHIQFFGRGLRIAPGKKECIVLDHSVNCARFWDQWNEFFENGAVELDDGRKREKKPPSEKPEISSIKCPVCAHLHTARPSCPSCGHEYPRRNVVKHEGGELREMFPKRQDIVPDLWPQICFHARSRKPYDDAGARKMALATYKSMTGSWPVSSFDSTKPVPVTKEVNERLKARRNDWLKSRKQDPQHA